MAIKNMEYVEIRTRHIHQSTAYYQQVFGWKMTPYEASPLPMMNIDTGVFPMGGLMQFQDTSVPLGITPYLTVEDCVHTARKAVELGATLLMDKQQVEEMGWFSMILDPWGNSVGFWQDKQRTPPQEWGLTFEGSGQNFCWLDLSAPDLDQATSFYSQVMGWQFHSIPEMPGYTFVKDMPMDDPIGVHGVAIMKTDASGLSGATVYVRVDSLTNTEATILAAGGSVILSQQPIPGTGTFSITQDPEGNRLAIIEMGHA